MMAIVENKRATADETHPQPTAVSNRVDPWRIAYTIQNVGLDLTQMVGDVVPVRNTLDGLRAAGHTVQVFELAGREVARIRDVSHIEQKGAVPLGVTGKRPFLLAESAVRRVQRMLKLPYFAFFDTTRFYDACRRFLPDFDLCHEHNGLFSPATALACRHLQKPYVLTFSADSILEREVVGDPLRGLHRQTAVRQARFTYTEADQILCVSNPAKTHLVEKWQVAADKINVMPNGVDIDLFARAYDAAQVRAEWGLGDAPVISFVGGFQAWHGLENLVESFATIWRQMPQARLLLVGDGPYRAALDAKIAACGVGEATIVTGLMPQSRVPALLSVADVAVLPYPQLPQDLWFSPLKLYEYMAAGKAVVGSRSGQIAEVVKNGRTGLLVEPGDVADLTAALTALLKDPAKRQQLGRAAQQEAIAQYSWENYIRRLESIYDRAVTNRQKRGS